MSERARVLDGRDAAVRQHHVAVGLRGRAGAVYDGDVVEDERVPGQVPVERPSPGLHGRWLRGGRHEEERDARE